MGWLLVVARGLYLARHLFTLSFKFNLIISNVWCQIVLVPNCPVPKCPGAKFSWCQIVHFYYLGAKLSAFIILVPNCPLYYLRAKLPVPNCPVPNCPTIKIRYHIFHFKHIHPQNEKQKKTIFHFNKNSNRFQSLVYSSMYMFEIERT